VALGHPELGVARVAQLGPVGVILEGRGVARRVREDHAVLANQGDAQAGLATDPLQVGLDLRRRAFGETPLRLRLVQECLVLEESRLADQQ
jgi:hypothetical protein